MKTETLYKRLLNREDMKYIPILTIIRVCIATVEELDECLEVDLYDEPIS